jgi:undecaprenyl diphosphate synthase
MGLILDHLEDEIFMKNNVRFRVIGDLERIPEQVRVRLHECMERTKKNEKMTMVIALSYSSRWELTHAMRQLAEKVKNGSLQPTGITEESIQECLATSFMPDPDLLIRTGGELRISNYLLWQCAYSEFYFCDTYWPDFDEEELRKAIADYQSRERRFGKTGEQVAKK